QHAVPYRDLHSFPTRRSSDLVDVALMPPLAYVRAEEKGKVEPLFKVMRNGQGTYRALLFAAPGVVFGSLEELRKAKNLKVAWVEIGEHTSELQSRSDLVCRLL